MDVLVDYYFPCGAMLPTQLYAWICMRHKQLYGIPDEATGRIGNSSRLSGFRRAVFCSMEPRSCLWAGRKAAVWGWARSPGDGE